MEFEKLSALTNARAQGDSVVCDREMTLKERFRQTMFFQDVDLLPNFEFGYWDRTLERWREEGLPSDVVDEASAYAYFGIENWTTVSVNPSILPVFERRTIEETDEYFIGSDEYGCVTRINKRGDRSIPQHIDFPVKDRCTWEPFKAALDPNDPKRWESFDESVGKLAGSAQPVGIYGGSLVGVPRNLMGFERIATMQYEDPELLTNIIDAFGACIVAVLERALPRIQVDFCMGWEDICFNQGPIISPDFYRRAVGPWYRKISDLLVAHGCCIYCTDCDGNVSPLVDLFLDNGMNTLFPVEVHGGADPCTLRDAYGRRLKLWGGVDKLKLAESKQAIDKELERLRPYVEQGAFIPGVDHRVPADVPLTNYLYYMDRKRELFRVGGTPEY